MTRILVQRGSGSSSSSSSTNQNRSTSSFPSSSAAPSQTQSPSNPTQVNNLSSKEAEVVDVVQEHEISDEVSEHSAIGENTNPKTNELSTVEPDQCETASDENVETENVGGGSFDQTDLVRGFGGLTIREQDEYRGSNTWNLDCSQDNIDGSQPPPPPIPPPKPLATNSNSRRFASGTSNPGWSGPSRRAGGWPVLTRTSPAGSRPSSPRGHCENEGYNSADEQSPCFGSSYDDLERERQFEIDIRRAKGLEVKRMQGDGNCLFRAVADQVYGDSEVFDLVRQMCIDYMERERDHFSQFITEGFTSYCKRKRRDKVYGNNVEIQAMSEMYNRPIHIYSYSTEPINIFHRNYGTDVPPIRLSFHHGNHYNSLVDPRRLNVGAGLGFSSLRGRSVDKDQVKAAIKAQQDQQIDNALLAEGRFYSDLELTEKEIERMVMAASRAEYLTRDQLNQPLGNRESSTSSAEPSSSGTRLSTGSGSEEEMANSVNLSQGTGLSNGMQMVLSMGFSYLQAVEAYSLFGDDVDAMVCYLLETSSGSSSRRKGKATE